MATPPLHASTRPVSDLQRLAELEQLVGVSSTVPGANGTPSTATEQQRCAVLRALGLDVHEAADAPTALLVEERRRAAQVVPTVLVAWEGSMRAPVTCPDGLEWTITPTDLNDPGSAPDPHTGTTSGRQVQVDGLAFGFHELTIDVQDHAHTALVISAPTRAFGRENRQSWGLRADVARLAEGTGDRRGTIRQLRVAGEFCSDVGADLLAIEPILAAPVGDAHGHAPLSRRFVDERILDLERFGGPPPVPGTDAGPRDPEADAARVRSTIDALLADDPALRSKAEGHLARNHEAGRWAQFRAAREMYGADWRAWPGDAARGHLGNLPLDSDRILRHGFVQWAALEQLDALADDLRGAGVELVVDLPAGSRPTGFDAWRRQDVQASGFRAGLPASPESPAGQIFDAAPTAPEAARIDHHQGVRESLEATMRHAGAIRLTQAASLERVWWATVDATDGVWVYQPMLETIAVITVLSHRHRCAVIAEDAGGDSERLAAALDHHGISRTWNAHHHPDHLPGDDACVELGAVDGPTLTGWWRALPPETRDHLGRLVDIDGNDQERVPEPVVHQLLERVGHSQAPIVLLPIEELWAEDRSDPTPRLETLRVPVDEWSGLDASILDTLRSARNEATDAPSWPPPGWWFGAEDQHLFNEGSHTRLWHALGARADRVDGVAGVRFAVWAPNARSVHVIGDMNGWAHPGHPLRPVGGSGVWDAFLPGPGAGLVYKYRLEGAQGRVVEKADPLAFKSESAPSTASVVTTLDHDWQDDGWMAGRHERNRWDEPISIYEVHLGSWRRRDDDPDRLMTYTEHVDELVAHVSAMGFTHVELLPITEHPLYASWGYQTTGYFAATSRYGDPTELMALVDAFHQAGIGVILDWVPSHFPTDDFALNAFDGTQLYEHADPREGFHPDWKSSIFNYGRHEVRSFLLSSARFWLEAFHLDGLRVDAVASMLYRDYSRGDDWVPNRYGGRENLEAIEFLQQLNHEMYAAHPDVLMIAEESTAWPGVTKPTDQGGLGFGYKWDMGWMNDSLEYFSLDPVHRRWHHNKLTFRAMYGWSENYVLPLSHDEVVHGKGSLLNKMPGDTWQKFANLRTLLGWQYTTPGKKLLFMGSELAPWTEWNHDAGLPWHLTGADDHEGVLQWVARLNELYRNVPALHAGDATPEGFAWIDADDNERSVLSFVRRDPESNDVVAVVLNNTPIVRADVMVGVPRKGGWEVIASSDDHRFGGAGHEHPDEYTTTAHRHNDFPQALWLTLPALSITILRHRTAG